MAHAPRMVRITGLALIAALALSGCVERSKRVLFDGQYYPTREKGVDRQDRKAFQITVRRVEQGIDGAREAGRHGASKYCIKNFGTSQVEWERGPDDAAETLQVSNGTLLLTGRCFTW